MTARTANTNDEMPNDVARDTAVATDDLRLERTDEAKPFWKIAPLYKAQLKALAVIWLALTAAYILVGLAIVQWWEPSGGGEAEARLAQWFDDQRSDERNNLAKIGSAKTTESFGRICSSRVLPLTAYRPRSSLEPLKFAISKRHVAPGSMPSSTVNQPLLVER